MRRIKRKPTNLRSTRRAKLLIRDRAKSKKSKAVKAKSSKVSLGSKSASKKKGKKTLSKTEAQDFILITVLELKKWKPFSRSDRINKIIDAIPENDSKELLDKYAHYLSVLLIENIKKAVKKQDFRKNFQPLNAAYKLSKLNKGHSTGFWEATGELIESISAWKNSEGNYYIGFKKDQTHSDSGTELALIASVLEKGSTKRNIPARPLLIPEANALGKGIFKKHFLEFLKKVKSPLYKLL